MADGAFSQASVYGQWRDAFDRFAKGQSIDVNTLTPLRQLDNGVAQLLAQRAAEALRVRLDSWGRDLTKAIGRNHRSDTAFEAAIVNARRQLTPIRAFVSSDRLFAPLRTALTDAVEETVRNAQDALVTQAGRPGPYRDVLLRIVTHTRLTTTTTSEASKPVVTENVRMGTTRRTILS
jgi:hypothetical protein